ncbi:hypothetical protein BpHYR1_049149 [Brachionus plicatilis]|uniref:Uncharacterized protein n=1 Tax=Brachionus plicatilis TaxID=10195 RepID=A0A3M7QZP5_BRAPC|nr:hypothetical protein BpHYR1_049149 [Brachionus plicatilis]
MIFENRKQLYPEKIRLENFLSCYFSKDPLEANSFNEINNALEKNNNNLIEPMAKSKSGEKTFEHFYSRLKNCFVIKRSILVINEVHVSNLKAHINKKQNSIKELFFLSKPPKFDYCLSLTIYFSKPAIQSHSNSYYISLFKLNYFKAQISKNPESPLPLKTQLIVNESLNKPYNLRNSNKFYTTGNKEKLIIVFTMFA